MATIVPRFPIRPCEDPAALCLRQRGDRFWGVCLCGIYQESAGSGAGSDGIVWRDDGVGEKRRCQRQSGWLRVSLVRGENMSDVGSLRKMGAPLFIVAE